MPKGSRERLWRPLDAFVPRAVANPIAALFKAYDFTLAMDFHTSRATNARQISTLISRTPTVDVPGMPPLAHSSHTRSDITMLSLLYIMITVPTSFDTRITRFSPLNKAGFVRGTVMRVKVLEPRCTARVGCFFKFFMNLKQCCIHRARSEWKTRSNISD